MPNKTVTIAMINWNGLKDTIECIKSLKQIDYQDYEVVLVDNGSSREQVEELKTQFEKDPQIKLIFTDKNNGFAGGTNIGILESLRNNSEFTLLLNNDTIVDPKFLTELVKVARSDEKIGVVTSRIYFHSLPNTIWSSGSFFNYYFPPLSDEYRGADACEVTDVTGCCMLVKNEVFNRVGMLNEDYFAYGEESDFNIRARKGGYKLYAAPNSIIWHKVSRSTGGGFNKFVAYYKMRNKIKFAIKNYPFRYWPSYFIFLVLYFLKESFKSLINGKFDVFKALMEGVIDAMINKSGEYHKKLRILEVGCGLGANAWYLSQKGKNSVIGIDLSKENIDFAKKSYPTIEFYEMNLEALDFPDNEFDEIYAMDVLEHIDNLDKALSEVKRVLKKGGKFIVNVPAEKSEYWLLKLRPSYHEEIHHVRIFKGPQMEDTLAKFGFRKITEKATGFLDHISLYYQFTRKRKTSTQLGIGTWRDSTMSKVLFVTLLFFRPHVWKTKAKFIPIWIITLPIGLAVSAVGNKIFPKSMYYQFQKLAL